MPRRLPVRPAKVIGNLFVLFVILVISLIYYSYVVLVWGPRVMSKYFFPLFLSGDHTFLFRQLLREYHADLLSCFLLHACVVFPAGNDY
jgi:hypothetical protein